MAGRGLKRLFLHAASIGFDSATGPIAVEAPLPAELEQLLSGLRSAP